MGKAAKRIIAALTVLALAAGITAACICVFNVRIAQVTDEESLVNALIENFETGREHVVVYAKGFSIEKEKLSSYMTATISNDGEDICIPPARFKVKILDQLGLWVFSLDYGSEEDAGAGDTETTGNVSETVGDDSAQADEKSYAVYTRDETDSAREETKKALDKACGIISESADAAGGTDTDKYRQIYVYLCGTVEYDFDLSTVVVEGDMSSPLRKNRGTYGALVKKKTVCTGYAAAYKTICDRLDLPCWVVQNDNHAWNLIRLNGKIYCVDATNGAQFGSDDETFFMIPQDEYEAEYGYAPKEDSFIPAEFSS